MMGIWNVDEARCKNIVENNKRHVDELTEHLSYFQTDEQRALFFQELRVRVCFDCGQMLQPANAICRCKGGS